MNEPLYRIDGFRNSMTEEEIIGLFMLALGCDEEFARNEFQREARWA